MRIWVNVSIIALVGAVTRKSSVVKPAGMVPLGPVLVTRHGPVCSAV